MNAAAPSPRLFASPLARRLAREGGLDLGLAGPGSGPGGRIVKADVLRALARPRPALPAVAPSPAAPPAAAAPASGAGYRDVPLTPVRRVIARRLAQAKREIPHFYLTADVRMDEVMGLRARLREGPRPLSISVNDALIRAAALALRAVPEVNAAWADEAVRRFDDVDVAVAVATDGGLITPIIRRADTKPLAAIGAEMAELAARARSGGLRPVEFQGGGFTISNLGMFGVREFSAIINPPQAAILAAGAVEARPVVENGALAVGQVMTLTLSVDHRIVDGAVAARFLAALKALLHAPLGLLV